MTESREAGTGTQTRYSLMEMAAQLDNVISLGRGDPDLHTPAPIVEGAIRRLQAMDGSAEVPPRGLESLRQALAKHYRESKGLDYDAQDEILVTNGAQEGLFLSALALLNPGDRVLIPDPRYSSYDQAIATAGAQTVPVPTGENYDFALQAETLSEHTDGARLLILVNPSNPTGALVTPDGVREIAAVARKAGCAVISDEVYERLVFDGESVLSLASCDGMFERTVTLSSFSKSYAMTGFRVGYLLGPRAFIDAATKLKSLISGPTPLFSQFAAEQALTGDQGPASEFQQIFAERRAVMLRGFDQMRIPYGAHGGGFFLWADISRFGVPAETFCRRLLSESRVLMFPGGAFGAKWESFVRISMLQPVPRLQEALTRIERFVESL